MNLGNNPLVSIAVASLRTSEPLMNLLRSIEGATIVDYEVVVATPRMNADARARIEKEHPVRFVFEDEPRGCVSAFNLAFSESRGVYICHVNDDCIYLPNAIDIMLKAIGDREVMGAFAFQEPDTNGNFVTRTIFGVDYANFGCIKKELFRKIGFWDSANYRHYGADPDAGLALKHAGYAVVPVMDAKIIHYCIADEVRKEHLREEASNTLNSKWKGIFY